MSGNAVLMDVQLWFAARNDPPQLPVPDKPEEVERERADDH